MKVSSTTLISQRFRGYVVNRALPSLHKAHFSNSSAHLILFLKNALGQPHTLGTVDGPVRERLDWHPCILVWIMQLIKLKNKFYLTK